MATREGKGIETRCVESFFDVYVLCVLHYRLCVGITSIFTNPPTYLEREL
jgi:hypothetical protein